MLFEFFSRYMIHSDSFCTFFYSCDNIHVLKSFADWYETNGMNMWEKRKTEITVESGEEKKVRGREREKFFYNYIFRKKKVWNPFSISLFLIGPSIQ